MKIKLPNFLKNKFKFNILSYRIRHENKLHCRNETSLGRWAVTLRKILLEAVLCSESALRGDGDPPDLWADIHTRWPLAAMTHFAFHAMPLFYLQNKKLSFLKQWSMQQFFLGMSRAASDDKPNNGVLSGPGGHWFCILNPNNFHNNMQVMQIFFFFFLSSALAHGLIYLKYAINILHFILVVDELVMTFELHRG